MQSRRVIPCVVLCALLVLSTRAHAETFHCTQGDTGCLIASIAKSNANGPGHDYLYLEKGSYFLTRVDNGDDIATNGLPVITGALTIVGAGQGMTLIAKDPNFHQHIRIFEVAPTGGLTIAYTTLSHGSLVRANGRFGGCIANRGSLMVYHSTIRKCIANVGGGISSGGQLTLESATIVENAGDFGGGGLSIGGPTLISRSWIGNNTARDDGGIRCVGNVTVKIERSVIDSNSTAHVQPFLGAGGIGVYCPLEITNSLISNNASYTQGGGIKVITGSLTIKNSTFWGNTTFSQGGALYAGRGTVVDLQKVAVLFNKADGKFGSVSITTSTEGGGIYIAEGAVATMKNSWLLWNEAAEKPNCAGEITMEGWNVIGDPTQFHPPGQPACD